MLGEMASQLVVAADALRAGDADHWAVSARVAGRAGFGGSNRRKLKIVSILDPSLVTGTILEFSHDALKEQLTRNEAVIRILQRLGLNVTPPADDFTAIYACALVKYGVFKSEPTLNLFRNNFVREAFRQAFYANDPAILQREIDGIVEWNRESGTLGKIDADIRREVNEFTVAFTGIVDDTRTPAQVRQQQQLEASIAEISARLRGLDELPKIHEVLTQLLTAINQLKALGQAPRPSRFGTANELVLITRWIEQFQLAMSIIQKGIRRFAQGGFILNTAIWEFYFEAQAVEEQLDNLPVLGRLAPVHVTFTESIRLYKRAIGKLVDNDQTGFSDDIKLATEKATHVGHLLSDVFGTAHR